MYTMPTYMKKNTGPRMRWESSNAAKSKSPRANANNDSKAPANVPGYRDEGGHRGAWLEEGRGNGRSSVIRCNKV